MFDEYCNPPPSVASPVPAVVALEPADSTNPPSSTTIDQDASSPNQDNPNHVYKLKKALYGLKQAPRAWINSPLEVTAAKVCVTAAKRLELKARSTLLMGIPFGGNAATKKTQRNLLKQQYENFTASSSKVLDQTFDRLQKLINQLEIHGESISQEDVN
ncbi:ribonuclease H-like domain-containing protein [Tanacetum coccineum]|uniref:Ribonuclease H-like domain-containing protein n=1 Tax=Tanacetum coccineum TaxID=301880 RepID=A0ABQ5BFL4_9ASTR